MFINSDFISALEDRGLLSSDNYIKPDNSVAMELTQADMLMQIISLPTVSENGFSVSVTEKETLKKQASAIYSKNGETGPGMTVIEDISEKW